MLPESQGVMYCVYGLSGEYSDKTEWVACVCHTMEKAKEIAQTLNEAVLRTRGDFDKMRELDASYSGMGDCVYNYYPVEIR